MNQPRVFYHDGLTDHIDGEPAPAGWYYHRDGWPMGPFASETEAIADASEPVTRTQREHQEAERQAYNDEDRAEAREREERDRTEAETSRPR